MRSLVILISLALYGCGGKQIPEDVQVKFLVRAESGDLYAEVQCRGPVYEPVCFFEGQAEGEVTVEAYLDLPVIGKVGMNGRFDSSDESLNSLCAQYLAGSTCVGDR